MKHVGDLTYELYRGLDLRKEIYSVEKQRLGDTILIYDKSNNHQDDASALIGLAIYHSGPRTEAGSGACYIKFGTIRPAKDASKHFDYLLDVCESFAKTQGLSQVVGRANTARHNAYRKMIERNFHTDHQGVAMHRPMKLVIVETMYISLTIGDNKRTFKFNAISKKDYPQDSTEIFVIETLTK